ncbi:dihydroneopterin aldolase [Defluviimonas sp. SAOS-178_SWC]|uniref:dihydroneopterin aldolase n=1 Tax=Defluviimonas sp. SAOS-178_SWC TaxID=3121287 RepID=UPI00322175F4
MTEDASLALGPLENRAAALAGAHPPDRLSLRDHIVSADIGAFQVERGQSQRLRFNVVVELAPQEEAGDDVDRILSYDRITEAIATELAAERLNLLETLAERIATRILAEPQPLRVFLRVEKLDRGPGALGVEIVRSRTDADAPATVAAAPRPVVHVLDVAGNLPEIRDAGPAVIVPDLPPTDRPEAATAEARRRIDLLEIEQAAWALAARHPGLTVVATRTELDWALKQGQTVVWAPSKIVLDTAGAPEATAGATLAAWLAEDLDATALVVHGDVAVPAACRVPVERA